MVNGNLKNEVMVKGAGLEYTLRPSFGCLMGIEERSKKSLMKIIEEFQNGQGALNDLIAILKEGTKAAGRIITDKEIEKLFEEEGIVSVQVQLADFFVKAMYGGKITPPKQIAEGTDQPKSIGTSISESQSLN